MIFLLKMVIFLLKMMIFLLKMVIFPLKMVIFMGKNLQLWRGDSAESGLGAGAGGAQSPAGALLRRVSLRGMGGWEENENIGRFYQENVGSIPEDPCMEYLPTLTPKAI